MMQTTYLLIGKYIMLKTQSDSKILQTLGGDDDAVIFDISGKLNVLLHIII